MENDRPLKCTWEKFLEAFPAEKKVFEDATDDYIDERLIHYGMWRCRQCHSLMPVELNNCKHCDCGRPHVEVPEEKVKTVTLLPITKKSHHAKRKVHGI